MGNARVTQSGVEVLAQAEVSARVTQAGIEVLSGSTPSTADIRLTQIHAESAQQYSDLPVRVSHVSAESAQQYGDLPVRLSQIHAEAARQYADLPVRVSQIYLEIARSEGCYTAIDATPVPPTVTTFPIRRLRRAPHIHAGMDWLYYALLELDIESGVGLESGQGSDPQIMLRWSDDGGHTWSNEHWVSAGKIGKYQQRAIWNKLGRARDRVFEISMSDPVKWVIIGARLNITKGTH